MEVIFSHHATDTLISIVSFIESKWNADIANKFVEKTYKVIDFISIHPYMFQATQVENVRKAVITKQTSVVYKIYPDHIEILFFWDNRQDAVF